MARLAARRTAALIPLTVAAVCLFAAPASAHAGLVGSTPAAGAQLTQAPKQVKLTFNENVRTPATIVVTGPYGRVSHGTVRVVDNTASVDVDIKTATAYVGRYEIAYRVVSADGHPVADDLSFDYRPPGVAAAPAHSHTGSGSSSSDTARTRVWLVGGVAVAVLLAGLLFGGHLLRGAGRRR
jgi:methionine-rich copper-binding protein CopC